MPGIKQNFETRFIRLIRMLDMMAAQGGIRRDELASRLSVPLRTLDRDIGFASRFFDITKTSDTDGGRRFHFDKWRFSLEQVMHKAWLAELELEEREDPKQNAPTLDFP